MKKTKNSTDVNPSDITVAQDDILKELYKVLMTPSNIDFNFEKYFIALIKSNVFFASISRQVQKIKSFDIMTAAVTFNKELDNFVFLYNPNFMKFLSEQEDGDRLIEFVIQHEYYHLIFEHLTSRKKENHTFWNIATDAAINSLLISYGHACPNGLVNPGNKQTSILGDEVIPKLNSLGDVISKWPILKSSEWYYNSLIKESKDNNWPSQQKIKVKVKVKRPGSGQPQEGGAPTSGDVEEIEIEFDSFDNHEKWDDISEEDKEMLAERAKQIIEKAVRDADQSSSNGWGTISSEMRERIRKYVSRQIDWRTVLRSFVGKLVRGERANSIKRINKKYPYIHPGTKRGYQAKLLIAIDQSGSISNNDLELFFAELSVLTQKISVTILPFDHTVDEKNMVEWTKGKKFDFQRTRCGGTDFNAPTEFVNEQRNRGKWDGLLILTDGECSKPKDSRIKRAWVIAPNRKMLFDTDETVILLSHDSPKTEGSWN